ITSLHLHPQSLAPQQLPAPQATIGDGRPWTMCHLRRRKNPPSSTINHPPSTINLPPSIVSFYYCVNIYFSLVCVNRRILDNFVAE
ncbi:MAG: hypothetical protein J6X12_02525, partial [Paludibacteraceae bacterium]|nr:hypothetical protein [Paludibacteraceae bacterium]